MCTYCCYRWIYEDEIIYIGKSKNLYSRLKSEVREPKFEPYLDKCKIEYTEFENNAQMSGTESLLIDKYKPRLNIVDKYDGKNDFIFDDSHLVWKDCTDDILADKYVKEANALRARLENIEEEIDLLNFKIFCLAKSYEMMEENIQRQFFLPEYEYKKKYNEEVLNFSLGKCCDANEMLKIRCKIMKFDNGNQKILIDFGAFLSNGERSNSDWWLGTSILSSIEEERLKLKTERDKKREEHDKTLSELIGSMLHVGWVKYDYSQYTDNVPFYILAALNEKEFADIKGQAYRLMISIDGLLYYYSEENKDDFEETYFVVNDKESMFIMDNEILYHCPAKSRRKNWDKWDESIILLRGVCRIKEIAGCLEKNGITPSVIERNLLKEFFENNQITEEQEAEEPVSQETDAEDAEEIQKIEELARAFCASGVA